MHDSVENYKWVYENLCNYYKVTGPVTKGINFYDDIVNSEGFADDDTQDIELIEEYVPTPVFKRPLEGSVLSLAKKPKPGEKVPVTIVERRSVTHRKCTKCGRVFAEISVYLKHLRECAK